MVKSSDISPFVQLSFDDLEEWRTIPGYNGRYEASSQGRIRRVRENMTSRGQWRSEIMALFPPDAHGYVRVGLMRNNGRLYRPGVHVLVAQTFLGECPEGCEVNHIDLNKSNNRVSNLEYITHQENIDHARRNGAWRAIDRRGERGANHKLTDADIPVIRDRVAAGESRQELAAEYGVSQPCISLIVNRKTWVHIR